VVLDDHAGRVDGYGNPLAVTAPALADEVAGAADLAQGKLAGRPVAVVRGLAAHVLRTDDDGPGARSLNRPLAEDMFALGAREAVVAALAGESPEAFGAPAPAADLVAALARVGVTATTDGERVRLADESGPEARAIAHAHGWVSDLDVPAVLQPHLP
jgi:coenzyme F420-0:L-glutamate ligase/coenzyme F420-1:gamma-L-glutamate ligase